MATPSWKMAVSTPNAAPTDSRFITEAVSGISRLRNTTISSRKLSSTTIPMNSGSLPDRTLAKSSKIAVVTADEDVQPGAAGGGRDHRVANVVEQSRSSACLRRPLRVDVGDRDRRRAGLDG